MELKLSKQRRVVLIAAARWWIAMRGPAEQTNDLLHEALTGNAAEALDGAVYKMELINESLAFSIENIQVKCARAAVWQ